MHAFKQQVPVSCISGRFIPTCKTTPAFLTFSRLLRYIKPSRCISVSTVASSSSVTSAGSKQSSAHLDRILFIGGLPGYLEPSTLTQQILAACSQPSYQPARVEVAEFQDDSERSRFMTAWKHKGHAFVAFTSSSAVSAAAEAVKLIPEWGCQATVGPARKLPPRWTPEITMTPEELVLHHQQQTATAARRQHNKRQRQRQQQRLVDSVAQILQALPPPGGAAVLHQYKPLLGDSSQLQSLLSAVDSSSRVEICQTADDGDVLRLLLSAMPAPLRSVIKANKLQQLLTIQQEPQQQPIQLAAAPSVAEVSQQLLFDWSQMPQVVDPAYGGQLGNAGAQHEAQRINLRALRKRVQVESFALLLLQLTLPALMSKALLHIVEFGCGSGNLVLPLAHLFPCFAFTAVDMKRSAVQLLQQRIQQSQLSNVTVIEGTIEQYSGSADVVLALHACGAASDLSLLQAGRCGAAFIVSPCCIGKISKNNTAGLRYNKQQNHTNSSSNSAESLAEQQQQLQLELQTVSDYQLSYPRSTWMSEQMRLLTQQVQTQLQQELQAQPLLSTPQQPQQQLNMHVFSALNPLQLAVIRAGEAVDCVDESQQRVYAVLAQAADYSHQEEHGYPALAALAKSNVEFDRGLNLTEAGFRVGLVRLLQPQLTAKSDVLLGVPGADRENSKVGALNTGPLDGSKDILSSRFGWVW